MSLFLKKVDRRARWLIPEPPLEWLKEGEAPADPLADIRAKEGKLSLWEIEEDRSNLPEVVVALAANRQHLDAFDYVLFSSKILRDLKISCVSTSGTTSHARANTYHRDAIEITVSKGAELARAIWLSAEEKERVPPYEVKNLIGESLAKGDLEAEQLSESLRKKLGP